MAARFEEKDKQLLFRVCKDRREKVSNLVRRAVMAELARLSYLPDSEKKALGVLVR